MVHDKQAAGLPNPSPNLTQVDSSFHRTPDFENEKAEEFSKILLRKVLNGNYIC